MIEAEPLKIQRADMELAADRGFSVSIIQKESVFQMLTDAQQAMQYDMQEKRRIILNVQIKLGRGVLKYTSGSRFVFEYGPGHTWEHFEKDLQTIRAMANICVDLEQLSKSGEMDLKLQVIDILMVATPAHASSASSGDVASSGMCCVQPPE